ncbi:MAG: flagellar hook-basal body complex protein FliE [Bacillota bacterium]|nr:flagellar hook-basal body complex protein FliE [Bacillota bacterium]
MAVSNITNIGTLPKLTPALDKLDTSNDNSVNFGDMLKDALNKVNDLQLQSQQSENDFAAGKTDNINQVMVATEKADLALQFTVAIRNKILDGYQEIMRMQI